MSEKLTFLSMKRAPLRAVVYSRTSKEEESAGTGVESTQIQARDGRAAVEANEAGRSWLLRSWIKVSLAPSSQSARGCKNCFASASKARLMSSSCAIRSASDVTPRA
jgi:hypothetical protein